MSLDLGEVGIVLLLPFFAEFGCAEDDICLLDTFAEVLTHSILIFRWLSCEWVSDFVGMYYAVSGAEIGVTFAIIILILIG